MFIDKARIYVRGGNGGNGASSFRREKYVPEGGPSGGDGGHGGNVVFHVDEGMSTLMDFRFHTQFKAEHGERGMNKNMHGRSRPALVVKVPPGTIVRNAETKEVIGDLTRAGDELLVAKGGRGGRGNARFVTPTNRIPTMAEKGEPGQELWLELELKLLADVGLVGYPNVGKSTFLSRVSAAKPKIGDYPFTTLTPMLGVVAVGDGRSFVLADIPGLIEGAHEGIGLGHEFLRHVERTRLLIHVLDISGSAEEREPIEDYRRINAELALYNEKLAHRPQVVAANKMDVPDAAEKLEKLRQALGDEVEIWPVSAITGEGLDRLMFRVADWVEELRNQPEPEVETVEELVRYTFVPTKKFNIELVDGIYEVSGEEIDRVAAMTDFDNDEAVSRFQTVLYRLGIVDALRKTGCQEGDSVRILEVEFTYSDRIM